MINCSSTARIVHRGLTGRLIRATVLTVTVLGSSAAVYGQAAPQPPSQVCILGTGDCASSLVSGTGVKFHPGVYIRMGSGESQADILGARIPEICAMPNVEGLLEHRNWNDFEQSFNSYEFAAEQELYEALAACGKRLIIQISAISKRNDSGTACDQRKWPAYLESGTYEGGVTLADDERCQPMYWKPAVMDRYIALMRAIATHFDGQPFFEAVAMSETALGNQPAKVQYSPGVDLQWDTGYSSDAFLAQLDRLMDAAKCGPDPFLPQTNAVIFYNFIPKGTWAGHQALYDKFASCGVSHGWPDTVPRDQPPSGINPGSTLTTRDRTVAQFMRIGDTVNAGSNGTDYRGVVACFGSVQPPEMGGQQGNYLPSYLHDELNSTSNMQCSHHIYTRKDYEITNPDYGPDEANWSSGGVQAPNGLKAFIESGAANVTGPARSCPANYSRFGGCQ